MQRDRVIERHLNILTIVIDHPMISIQEIQDRLALDYSDPVHPRTVRRALYAWERQGFVRCYERSTESRGGSGGGEFSHAFRAMAKIVRV